MTDAQNAIDLDKAIDAIADTGVEKGLEKFLNDAEFQAILVREICEEFDDLNPRLVRFVLKRLAPLVAKAGGKSLGWLGDMAQQRLKLVLTKTPGYAKVTAALQTVLTKADLAQRGEAEIAAIRNGELRADEAEHLEFLSGDLSRHAAIISDLAGIKADIAQLLNPQPPLKLDIIKDETGQNRFYYGARYIDFQGRHDELAALDAFLNTDAMVSWHLMLGAGGQGKSRLALELCLQVGGGWRAGFLKEDSSYMGWETWTPDQPTLIVVDYVARRGETIGKIIRHAARNQAEFVFPVRFLLLERGLSGDDQWFNDLQGAGLSDQAVIDTARYTLPAIDLPNPGADELWAIMSAMNTKLDIGRKDECLDKLSSIDEESRPLYAAFLAEALGENDDALKWNTTELARNILKRDQAKFWPENISRQDKNLLALATMCGGWPTNALEGLEDADLLPNPNDDANYQHQAEMTGHPAGDEFQAFEPDLLGELFVLETLEGNHLPAKKRHDALHTLAWHAATENMEDFLVRCARDFPAHKTLKTLSMPIENQEFDPAVISGSSRAVAGMAHHLRRAGEGALLREHSETLGRLLNNAGHEAVRFFAAQVAALIYYDLIQAHQTEAANTLANKLFALADQYPNTADVQVPKASILFDMILGYAANGKYKKAETLTQKTLEIVHRFPTHLFSLGLLRATTQMLKLLEDLKQLQKQKTEPIP